MSIGKMPALGLAAILGLAPLAEGARADGWLRRRFFPPPVCESAPAIPEMGTLVQPPKPTDSESIPLITPPKSTPPPSTEEPPVATTAPPVEPSPEAPRFEPLVSAALGESSLAVGAAYHVNMHGDQFVTSRGRSSFTRTVPGPTLTLMGNVTFPGAIRNPSANFSGSPPYADFRVASNPAVFNGLGFPPGTMLTLAPQTIVQPVTPPPPGAPVAGFNSTPQVQTLVNPLAQPGGAIYLRAQAMAPNQVSAVSLTVGNAGEAQNYTADVTTPPLNYPSDTADLQYPLTMLVHTLAPQTVFIDIPNPSSGGVVGRAKISEDSNPLPRDRFIFNYDYFNDTALTSRGIDVHKYVVGIEKTMFDGRASIEARLPFASTLDSTQVGDQQSRNTELGNLRITPRFLLYGSDTINVGGGLGIHLPTAADTRFQLIPGSDLIRVENESVVLTPYLAAVFTPNDRVFAQTWLAFDFDTRGNPVRVNFGNGLTEIGMLRDASLMQTDLQIGYWAYKPADQSTVLRAVAPFAELHYGTTIEDPGRVESGGLVIGDLTGRHDELNLAAGLTALIGDRTLVSIGGVTPLRNGDDRGFEYQIGVRVNYFFGPNPSTRGPAYLIR